MSALEPNPAQAGTKEVKRGSGKGCSNRRHGDKAGIAVAFVDRLVKDFASLCKSDCIFYHYIYILCW